MKITKTQLQSIIKEELASLKEVHGAYSYHTDEAGGISEPLTTDAPGMTGVAGVGAAMKNIGQAELLISQAVDFFSREGGMEPHHVKRLTDIAAELRRYKI